MVRRCLFGINASVNKTVCHFTQTIPISENAINVFIEESVVILPDKRIKVIGTTNFEKANELIRTFEYAGFGVIDENGYPSVSAISLSCPKNISELSFTTTMDSNKVKRLQKNNKASINCYTSMSNITLVGECEIFSDQETKGKYWQDWVAGGADVYPGGVSDPNYCFVRFTTKRVSLWIDEEGTEFVL